ncbi:hypothetical protein WG899_11440 [Paucibacter sp. AS339]|uniref:hypothetical protein n=1 Tax=Paucibacter hankyongi TaxID=3133434 RepID=UPI00309D78C3
MLYFHTVLNFTPKAALVTNTLPGSRGPFKRTTGADDATSSRRYFRVWSWAVWHRLVARNGSQGLDI